MAIRGCYIEATDENRTPYARRRFLVNASGPDRQRVLERRFSGEALQSESRNPRR
jgi:hypothetical protein